jgi:hypothetical protein
MYGLLPRYTTTEESKCARRWHNIHTDLYEDPFTDLEVINMEIDTVFHKPSVTLNTERR